MRRNTGQVALMMTARIILNKRSELFQNALAESLPRDLTKVAERLPIRFREAMGHRNSSPSNE